jgi:hypothetical protein
MIPGRLGRPSARITAKFHANNVGQEADGRRLTTGALVTNLVQGRFETNAVLGESACPTLLSSFFEDNAALHHEGNFLQGCDVVQRISRHSYNIGVIAGLECADLSVESE